MTKIRMSFYDDYKPIRNKIRQYDPISIVSVLVSKLHELYHKPSKDWDVYLPWELLLLMKWVLANYESANTRIINKSAKQADLRIINGLINSLQDLFDKHRVDPLIRSGDNQHNLQKFFRQTAFQQFWLQPSSKLTISLQARAFYLFYYQHEENEALQKIDRYFFNKAGISINTFFEISLIIWTKYHVSENKDVSITKEWFRNCAHNFTDKEIDKYFKLLSLDLQEAKEYANNDIKKKNERGYDALQILEQSPFTFYPFLRFGDKYILYSPALLDYTVKYFIYDFLKRHEGGGFSSVFGKDIFECYLKKGLEYSGLDFKDENTQHKKNKKVDFLIESGDRAILIEAKAVEMANIAPAKADNESIIKALEKSVLKGIKQAYSVANSLNNKTTVYALIVTYKELFLGRTGSIWDEFLGNSLEEFLSENNIDTKCISPDHIYILSVDDFDKLMQVIKNDHDIFKILDFISEQDKDDIKGRHAFGVHLNKFLPKDDSIPPHLEDMVKKLYDKVESRFSQ